MNGQGPDPKAPVRRTTVAKALLLNGITLALAILIITSFAQPPLLVILALLLAHLLNASSLALLDRLNQTRPSIFRPLIRAVTRPPTAVQQAEVSHARLDPAFNNGPFFKHFVVVGFLVVLLYVIADLTKLPLDPNLWWTLLLGISYWVQGIVGGELIFDPEEDLAANSFYNETALAAILLAVVAAVFAAILLSPFRGSVQMDWALLGFILVIKHSISLHREIAGPIPFRHWFGRSDNLD